MTIYAAPHRFAHGDIPTAAQLQTYCTALDAIHERMGDALRIYASAHLKVGEDNNHWGIRRPIDRYLVVFGDGTLTVQSTGVGDQAITDSDAPTRFDMDTLNIPVGSLFYVSDSTWVLIASAP